MQPYTEQFFRHVQSSARQAAQQIVPVVLELVSPQSVIDVGCGVGTWLAVFQQHGLADVVGVDGDYVDRKMLDIPASRFLARDLKRPLDVGRQFDLVVSLEVAEHLPPECAAGFVESLTRLGPVVLFSAAIPFQKGTQHLNEQWPDYWARLFEDRRYTVIDGVRRRIWHMENLPCFYLQNMLIFVREDALTNYPRLAQEKAFTHRNQLSLVHPRLFADYMSWHERVGLTAQDIGSVVPPGEAFVLVDQEEFRSIIAAGARAFPFLERNGQYWGQPEDDATAIRELERMCQAGAAYIVFGWPSFWWLDHYKQFANHIAGQHRCLLDNDRVKIYSLRQRWE